MPSAAKQKGNAWEREVAKDLSEVFNENFIRVPNSGAYTGGANFPRLDQLTESQKRMMDGDIMVPPCMSRFKLECKNYKTFDYHKLFTNNKIEAPSVYTRNTIEGLAMRKDEFFDAWFNFRLHISGLQGFDSSKRCRLKGSFSFIFCY